MFVGKVLSVTVTDRQLPSSFMRQRLYRIAVMETFGGSQRVGEEVTVATGMGGGDCGYGLTIGQRYLVDAYKTKLGLETGICSLTAPEDEAVATIRELRTVLLGGRLPDLSGRVATGPWINATVPSASLEGIAVTVTSDEGVKYQATTDGDGIYALATLPPGEYTVKAELPSRFTTYEASEKKAIQVKIPDAGGTGAACHADVRALPSGHIPVRFVSGDGKPPDTLVSAYRLEQGQELAHKPVSYGAADGNGIFDVKFLPEGDYLLQVVLELTDTNREAWYYPGVKSKAEATAVHVEDGKASAEVVFRIR